MWVTIRAVVTAWVPMGVFLIDPNHKNISIITRLITRTRLTQNLGNNKENRVGSAVVGCSQ